MELRKLGNSKLNLSMITYGSFGIGGTMWGGTEKEEALDAIETAIDNGITTLDTAPFYGLGLSEQLIGEVLQQHDRSKLQVLTKFGMVWDGSNQGKGEFMFDLNQDGKSYPVYKYASASNVIKETEESLKRLNTDYIDLLQLHWPDSSTPIDETMEALDRLISQGKILAAGVSNFDRKQMLDAHSVVALASNQVPYSMLNRQIEKEVVPAAMENNIGIIAYSPLERGLLSGKYFQSSHLAADDHRNDYFKQFDLDRVKGLLEALQPLARDKNVSLTQLVLRWTTLQPGISIVLAGARNREQSVANAKAAEIVLTDQELKFIDKELALLEPATG